MPYRDLEKRRLYKKAWYQNKKAKNKNKKYTLTELEQRKNNDREKRKRYRLKRRKVIETAFGTTCFFCKLTSKIMVIHRKDGKKHRKFCTLGLADLEKEILTSKKEYELLCGFCHRGIHWSMKFLKINMPV